MSTITVRITAAIERDIEQRAPDHLPVDKLVTGPVNLSRSEAQALLEEAEFNSNPRAVTVGPDHMPLGTFNAYRALARQLRRILKETT